MAPVNNVFLGGPDPLLGVMDPSTGIDERMAMLEAYQKKLVELKQAKLQMSQQQETSSIWSQIDAEVYPLTEEQKIQLSQNPEYERNNNNLQQLVQTELLNLVRSKIENSQEGKELLTNQLTLVKTLKKQIIEHTNKEMEAFRKFKEYAKSHQNVTYEEFIKTLD